jgi:hypothetical protein
VISNFEVIVQGRACKPMFFLRMLSALLLACKAPPLRSLCGITHSEQICTFCACCCFCYPIQAKPGVKLKVIGETIDGHDLNLLQLGTPGPGKPNVWIIARQHPGAQGKCAALCCRCQGGVPQGVVQCWLLCWLTLR